jgi:isoleucyl-tRNA synthetase
MKRVPEVIDCWFDSGAMPFAQYHYPFENKELFEKNFPASFISEAVDQTRGWFYSLHAISTLLFNKPAYKNVVVLGLVLDKDGEKMSKSKGNAVDPFDALQKHGADAIRWYFYSNSAPWLPNKFHDKAVQEGQRKFLGTLWNTYAFYTLYAEIDQFDPTKYTLDYASLPVMDKWLLSRMNTMIKKTDDNLDRYRIPEAATALSDFVDEMSNWYVRRCRDRFWAKGMEQDKINAYMTLYTALVTTAKAAAPMIPFMTESIYRNLVCSIDKAAPVSVHLADYPVADEALIDTELEKNMELVLSIVVLGRAARNEANIKNRQPIGHMYVKAESTLDDFFKEIVEDELNVKEVVFKEDMEDFTVYTFKPNFRALGPKVGKNMGAVKSALTAMNGRQAKEALDKEGSLKVTLADGTEYDLTSEEVEIAMSQAEGYNCQSYGEVAIALETTLSEELLEEGFLREIISKVQTMRKENGYEVTDHIKVGLSGNDKLLAIVKKAENEEMLRSVTLADEVVYGSDVAHAKEWNINGETVVLSVE